MAKKTHTLHKVSMKEWKVLAKLYPCADDMTWCGETSPDSYGKAIAQWGCSAPFGHKDVHRAYSLPGEMWLLWDDISITYNYKLRKK